MKRLFVFLFPLVFILGPAGTRAGELVLSLGSSLSGTVLEVKDVPNYTYLLLRTTDGEIWAAVSTAPVQVGADVTIVSLQVMDGFESPTLNRTFDRIVFGGLGVPGDRAGHHNMAAMHAATGKPADVAEAKVAKATGSDARTVAEIVAGTAALKDRLVSVRGQVAKFTPDVMGKNWIHLRDGTGSAADGSNDVLIVTADAAGIGDVVLVKGVVRTDRDLGSGYAYKVLIEDATLQK